MPFKLGQQRLSTASNNNSIRKKKKQSVSNLGNKSEQDTAWYYITGIISEIPKYTEVVRSRYRMQQKQKLGKPSMFIKLNKNRMISFLMAYYTEKLLKQSSSKSEKTFTEGRSSMMIYWIKFKIKARLLEYWAYNLHHKQITSINKLQAVNKMLANMGGYKR